MPIGRTPIGRTPVNKFRPTLPKLPKFGVPKALPKFRVPPNPSDRRRQDLLSPVTEPIAEKPRAPIPPRNSPVARVLRAREPYAFQRPRARLGQYPRPPQPGYQPNQAQARISKEKIQANLDYWAAKKKEFEALIKLRGGGYGQPRIL